MSANLISPNERNGRRTYANAKWRDMQNKHWPWYGIRPNASGGFKVLFSCTFMSAVRFMAFADRP